MCRCCVKLCCISDLHGCLPPTLPESDLIVLAGDICPVWNHAVSYQLKWLDTTFRDWLGDQEAHVVATWGNHDFCGEQAPDLVPDLNWTLLNDSGAEIQGVKFYGIPYTIPFGKWAFGRNEMAMKEIVKNIPWDTEVLISHGPPSHYGDRTHDDGSHLGGDQLATWIDQYQPKLTVCGHIHGGYGRYQVHEDVAVINASLLNERYAMTNAPILYEF